MKKSPLLFFLFSLIACDENEKTHQSHPRIDFQKIEFDHQVDGDFEKLSITFSYVDDDDDFGLDGTLAEHSMPPYQRGFYFLKSTGEMITSDKLLNHEISLDELIRLDDKAVAPFDTLPDLSPCFYYSYNATGVWTDTESIYWVLNKNYYNLFVEFFYQDADGQYVEFDFHETFCFSFDARVFAGSGVEGPFSVHRVNQRITSITYTMHSLGFIAIFGDKKMKLRIHIQDRALNKSNVIETPEFVLGEI